MTFTRVLAMLAAGVVTITAIGTALPARAAEDNNSAGETVEVSNGWEAITGTSGTDQAENEQSVHLETTIDETNGALKVTADADDGVLPSNTDIAVKKITKADDGETYASVEQQITDDAASKGRKVTGFLAYDISFVTKDGDGNETEVEPDGNVNIHMDWSDAAQPGSDDLQDTGGGYTIAGGGAGGTVETNDAAADVQKSDVSVLHLKADSSGTVNEVEDLTASPEDSENAGNAVPASAKSGSGTNTAAVQTTENNAVKTVDMTVDSFSVFTITWTKSANDATRVGQVKLHYVDVNGLEIDRTAELGNGDLSKVQGTTVEISDWVNDSNGTRKVSGYKYVRAAIGNINGDAVTAIKVDTDSVDGAYKLSYTSDGNNWRAYTDPVSGNQASNADIYLVFKSTAQRVNVHFVDEDGNILINPVYVYSDSVYDETKGNDGQVGKPVSNMERPIQNYKFTGRVHMGETGWQGFAFSVYRAQKDTDGNYRFQYKLKAEDTTDWIDLTATDVYLIYKKETAAIKVPVEIKYVDNTGAQMKDEAGNPLDRTVDAADWTAGTWQNLEGYSEVVDGYTISDHGIVVGANETSLSNTDFTRATSTGELSSQTFQNITGYSFRYIRYTSDGKFQFGDGAAPNNSDDKIITDNTKVNRYWTINKSNTEFTIYLVYNANTGGKTHTYTIHYIDESRNEIANPSNPATLTVEGQTIAISTVSNFANYSKRPVGLLGRSTEAAGGIPFTSIVFHKNGSNWNYTINNGTSTASTRQLNLTNLNIYVIYERTNLTVHFVDTDGNELKDTSGKSIGTWQTRENISTNRFSSWNGFDITVNTGNSGYTGSDNYVPKATAAGYTFVGEYIGPTFNMNSSRLVNTSFPGGGQYIQWLYQNGKWYTSHGNSANQTHPTDGTDPTVVEGRVTDVYWVYQKTRNALNIHYVYIGTGNTLQLLDSAQDQTGVRPGAKGSPTVLSSGDYVKTFSNYIHIGTRIGPAWPAAGAVQLTGKDLGPYVDYAYYENGQLKYGFDNADSEYSLERQGISDVWIYAESTGRRFTLRKTTTNGSDNYTLEDSQHGTFDLNLTSETDAAATYTAVFAGENETTEYTVTRSTTADGSGASTDTYKLTLQDTLPNNQTDVYELYIDNPENEAKIWIDDDLKYSGYFMAGENDWLKTRMKSDYSGNDKISSWYYTWEKTVTGTADTTGEGPVSTTTATVERQQNGIHWNLAYDRSDRTWLDIEADNGGLNTTTQQKVSYTLTLHYRIGEGAEWKTVSSVPISVHYYDQLMNGSFETPVKTAVKSDRSDDYYTNSFYEENGGVWQTTASDGLIEIVDANDTSKLVNAYQWNSSTPFNTTDSAEGNHQFAELNAASAGALYQDVVTHPNQHLNYWLSHRARGDNQRQNTVAAVSPSLPQYDTMYLIIMPTKLAMTSAADGGELKTQDDLVRFINNHGGYDNNLGTAVGQEITYRDETNGILIVKITSNDQFWHTINVPNGYIAKAGLTRFFFAAGPTSADYRRNMGWNLSALPTQGNFIDAVGLSQELPKPNGFNLQVSKTFTGLNDAALASLVSGGKAETPFTITIADKALNEPKTAEETGTDKDNPSLNGARLSFTTTNTSGTYTFTPTAVDASGRNLLTGSNTGEVIRNDNNSITMTWTFVNQTIRGDYADASFDYRVAESNDTVENNSLTATRTISPVSTVSDDAAIVSEGTSAYITLNNTYRNHGDSDQPRIIVSKTFYGLTPSGVEELFSGGYNLTVTNTTSGSSLNGSSIILNLNNEAMGGSVSYEKNVDENTHNTTIRWTIQGWDAGTYTVKESGYNTNEYKIMHIRVNNNDVTDLSSMSFTGATDIVVGGNNAESITLDSNSGKSQEAQQEGSGLGAITEPLAEGTNLIIAQYTDSASKVNYLVWTPEPLGANVSQGIINKINAADNGFGWTGTTSTASKENTVFRSGENPGTITSAAGGSISYDSNTRILSFTSAQGASWKKFYSGKITSDAGAADINVENRYSVVRIKKVDSSDTDKILSGAEFILYRLHSVGTTGTTGNETTNTGVDHDSDLKDDTGEAGDDEDFAKGTLWSAEENEIVVNDIGTNEQENQTSEKQYYSSDKEGSWTENKSNAYKFVTGDDGTVMLPKNLPTGTYYLEEITAPAGYNFNTKPVGFQITADGTVTGATVDGTESATVDWRSPYYTITISNGVGFALPKTGGKGTMTFILSGSAVALIAGTWLWLRYLQQSRTHGMRGGGRR